MSIESRLLDVVRERVTSDVINSEISASSRLCEDLGFDSLDVIELIMAVEAEFDLDIADEHADKFYTVGDILSYLTAT